MPSKHSSQVKSPATIFPGAQLLQAVLPSSAVLPLGQALHGILRFLYGENVWGAHRMQFFCPTLSIYSPGIQGKLKLKLKRETEKSYLGKKKRFNQLVEKGIDNKRL